MSYNNTQQYFLGDLYDISSGLSKSKDQFGSGYPFLSFKTVFNHTIIPTDLKDLAQTTLSEQNKYSILYGDVFLTRTSETANELGMSSVALKDYPQATFNGFTKRLRPKKGVMEFIDPKFIAYYLRSKDFRNQIDSISVLTTRASLNQGMIEKLTITVPNIKTQKKIAAILSALDEKIATNREINDNLEQQVSALYQSWFEDFEPSNGICPEHWSYQELSTIANIVSGKRPPIKSEVCNQETSIPIVGAASIMGFTSQSNHTDKILVTGRVGTHGVVQRFNVPCWTSDNTLVITSPFYEFTNQILCRIDYSSMNRGSTQPLITQGDMKKVIVLIPDEKTLAKFEEFAGSLMAKWEANNHENIQLALLRDSLLPKLMSGEIDVSAVQL